MTEKSIPTINLDQAFWEQIKQAAAESKWITDDYFKNDWVSDVCQFLREGPREPKLYYFNPNTYGTEWFVAAYSREEAIAAVEAHIRAEVATERFYDDNVDDFGPNNSEDYRSADQKRTECLEEKLWCLAQYVNATPWPHSPRESAPCIEEHPIGKVIQTEIS